MFKKDKAMRNRKEDSVFLPKMRVIVRHLLAPPHVDIFTIDCRVNMKQKP